MIFVFFSCKNLSFLLTTMSNFFSKTQNMTIIKKKIHIFPKKISFQYSYINKLTIFAKFIILNLLAQIE